MGSYNRRDTLTEHILVRHGGKRYKCRLCGETFDSRNAIVRHLRQDHDARSDKPILSGKAESVTIEEAKSTTKMATKATTAATTMKTKSTTTMETTATTMKTIRRSGYLRCGQCRPCRRCSDCRQERKERRERR